MAHQLSNGAVEEIFWKGATGAPSGQAYILQVNDVKKIGSATGQNSERFRLTISDGRHYCQAMLATQLNRLVTDKQLEKFSIIQVQDCICNVVQNRRIVILLNVEPKGMVDYVIGSPCSIENNDPGAAATVKVGSQGSGRVATLGSDANPSKLNFASPQDGAHSIQEQQNQNQGFGRDQVKQEYGKGNTGGGGFDGGHRGGGIGGGNQDYGGRGGGGNNDSGGRGGGRYNDGGYQGSGGYDAGRGGGGQAGSFQGGQGIGGGGRGAYNSNSSTNNDSNRSGSYGGGGGGGGGYGGNQAQGGGDGAYGGNRQPPSNNQGGRGRGGIMERDQGGGHVIPIMSLNAFNSSNFTIVARVTVKGGVRTYKNQKGEGRVGSIDLLDSSGDIRGTFFNDECDRWMSTLAVNTVYKIKGGQIKQANRQYNNCKSDCEITFGRDTVFEPLGDADAPKITYNFLKIEEIEQVEPGRPIDILAIVQMAHPVSNITVKSGANAGNQVGKRDVTLVDQSMKTIKLTLWDENVHLVNEHDTDAPVIAVKGAKVSDFGGRSLSLTRNSMHELNPDLPAAHALKGWYVNQGKHANFVSMSGAGGGGKNPRKFVCDIKNENLGHGEKPDFFSLRVWVTFFKHDGTYCYVANPENKKKVIQQGDNWFDESLNKVIDNPERRYVLSLSAADHTGATWLSAFNDEGVRLLGGHTADQLNEWKEAGDQNFEATFHANTFKPYVINTRGKSEMWQDESRVKCTVTGVTPLDFREGCAELLDLIRAYNF